MELTELHEIKLMQLNVPFTSEGHDKDVLSIIVYVGGDNADIISLHQIRVEIVQLKLQIRPSAPL